jgi:hypothetical protein
VTEHMRGHLTPDLGTVGHLGNEALNGARRDPKRVMDGKVILDQRPNASRELQDPALGFGAVRSALAVDGQPLLLPVNIVFPEPGQLCDSEARIEQGPDHQLFLVRSAGVGQAGSLVCG